MFDEARTYFAGDPELLEKLGTSETAMAVWRCRKIGPAYYRFGRRVAYSGKDLNAWVEARRVDTAPAPAPA